MTPGDWGSLWPGAACRGELHQAARPETDGPGHSEEFVKRFSIRACLLTATILAGGASAEAQSAASFRTREYYAGGFLAPLDLASVYAMGLTGAGVRVGVVDTGVDASHPDLINQIADGWDFFHDEPISPGENHDTDSHGTHVNGIIAAARNGRGMHGVAFGATLVPTAQSAIERYPEDADYLADRNWHYLADSNVPIINNSFGYDNCNNVPGIPCNVTDFTREYVEHNWPLTVEALHYVVERDVLMVFAAGNASQSNAAVLAGMPYFFPELESNWLAVVALDEAGELADYTNICGVAMDWCVSAPGFAWSTIPVYQNPRNPYAIMQGTSMASPVVSGVAALVKEAFPWFTAHDLQQSILTTATDVGPEGVDPYFGWGVVNPNKAVLGYGAFVETATLDTQGYDSTFGNDIVGPGGLIKIGEGTLTLAGDNSYTGDSIVREGGLAVQGTVAGTVIAEIAGTLSGNGTVGRTIIADGGTIAPGNSIGTLTVAGDYVQEAGGTYAFEFDATHGDQIIVEGMATLDGTLAMIPVGNTFRLGTIYDLILADGGVEGGFAEVVDASAFLTGALDYGADGATLTLVQARSFADAGATANEIAAGRGLDTLAAGEYQNAFLMLPTVGAASAVLGALTGEIGPSAKTVMLDDSALVRSAILTRLSRADEPATRAGIAVAKIGGEASAVWAQGFGAWGSTDSDGNAAGMDRDTGGFFIGADTLVQDTWRIGALGGYSRTTFDLDGAGGSGDVGTIQAALYAGATFGAVRLRTGAAYGWSDVDTGRGVSFPTGQQLSASYDAGTAQAFGELGYGITAGKVDFEPFAGLAYVNLNTSSFTEQGGAAALSASGDSTETSFTTLGLRAETAFEMMAARTVLQGMLGWRHAFGDVTPTTTYQFVAGSAPFVIAGLPVAEDALVLDLGLDVAVSKAASLGIAYSGQYGDGSADQSLKGSLDWKF